MKKRHSAEQIIRILKEVEESGSKGLEVCREMEISEQTLENWKRRFGGMGVGDPPAQSAFKECVCGSDPTWNRLSPKRYGRNLPPRRIRIL